MSLVARVEAAELVPCPVCGSLAGARCRLGPNKKKLDPDTLRGPHQNRIEVAHMLELLKPSPSGSVIRNRSLTAEQQEQLDTINAGGPSAAKMFLADEDKRAQKNAAKKAAEDFRGKWLVKQKAKRKGTKTQGLGKLGKD